MAWGIFKKIESGINKGFDFVGNTVLPTARKIIDIAKPLLQDTKFGKVIEKSDDILTYGEDVKKKIDKTGLFATKGKNQYNSSKLMKPEFTDDEDDDFE